MPKGKVYLSQTTGWGFFRALLFETVRQVLLILYSNQKNAYVAELLEHKMVLYVNYEELSEELQSFLEAEDFILQQCAVYEGIQDTGFVLRVDNRSGCMGMNGFPFSPVRQKSCLRASEVGRGRLKASKLKSL